MGGTHEIFMTPGWRRSILGTVVLGVMDLVHLAGSCPADTCGSILWLRTMQSASKARVCAGGITCRLPSILLTSFNFLHILLEFFFSVDVQEPLEPSKSCACFWTVRAQAYLRDLWPLCHLVSAWLTQPQSGFSGATDTSESLAWWHSLGPSLQSIPPTKEQPTPGKSLLQAQQCRILHCMGSMASWGNLFLASCMAQGWGFSPGWCRSAQEAITLRIPSGEQGQELHMPHLLLSFPHSSYLGGMRDLCTLLS